MSNKGAIKKTLESKDGSRSHTQSKMKVRTSTDISSESQVKSDVNEKKVQQSVNRRGAGDVKSKPSQNVSNKLLSSRSKSKDSVPQKQTTQQNVLSSTTKTSVSSPRIQSQLTNRNTTTRVKSEVSLKTNSSRPIEKNKSREKSNTGYMEKRGLSTVYMPKSSASKLASKITGQVSTPKSIQSSRHRENVANQEKITKSRPRQPSKERRKSRTLSPSEVKVLHTVVNVTSGLKDTISQQHSSNNFKNIPNDAEDEYDYEDDFEDYESDFQECTDSEESQISEESEDSTSSVTMEPVELRTETQVQRKTIPSAENRKIEEEHMLDSGHYELAEARKRAARIESMSANQPKTPPLPEVRQPVARGEEKNSETKSLPLSTDEGFEDGRSGDFTKSPPISQMCYIDFKKCKDDKIEKERSKILSRGRELLGMIKLDIIEWSLLESSPVTYEEFICNYGKLNTQQMSVQTNEDNLNMETQTDDITCSNKWTQFPVSCKRNLNSSEDIKLFKMEQIGVGSDDSNFESPSPLPNFDILQLNDFLSKAGRMMLSLLEERKFGGSVLQNDKHELPFSNGLIRLSIDSVTFLSGRPVTIIHYSEALRKVLLTVHSPVDEVQGNGIETSSKQNYITDSSIGCIWNISEPSKPTKLFYSPSPISACCFHSIYYNVIFAGLREGSISLWDLREDEMWHQRITDKANETDWIIRSATYTTAGNIENGHTSEIVAIRILSKIHSESSGSLLNQFIPIQICSLDEDGCLIIWSVLKNIGVSNDDLGLSQWGNVKLVKSQEILVGSRKSKIDQDLQGFVDMHVDSIDANNIYLATNSSNILRATCLGRKVSPSIYKENDMDVSGATTCIERCPFKESFFLVGCNDGTVRLHSLNVERPLLQLKDAHCKSAIRNIQWSKSKPFTIYVLDYDSKICIWDLGSSDLFPIYEISTNPWGRICSMELSPCKNDHDMINQYLAFGTDTGTVEIHMLKKDFHYSKMEETQKDLNTFLRYVEIL
ncbi:WD repeat-containing protein 60 isoform X3 [Cephus cinctus]|uniref:WD repeat-containing protein 60 isoform X3 n=1 Tax=Cephus cinctus TaxID=211228 RepID=A0AAJ7RL28_CEPCN|nr:WD repeat-containing protein 60 isoform X3 [Cephus cinctus]